MPTALRPAPPATSTVVPAPANGSSTGPSPRRKAERTRSAENPSLYLNQRRPGCVLLACQETMRRLRSGRSTMRSAKRRCRAHRALLPDGASRHRSGADGSKRNGRLGFAHQWLNRSPCRETGGKLNAAIVLPNSPLTLLRPPAAQFARFSLALAHPRRRTVSASGRSSQEATMTVQAEEKRCGVWSNRPACARKAVAHSEPVGQRLSVVGQADAREGGQVEAVGDVRLVR